MTTPIHPMFINGAWREGSEGGLADDVNPATGAVFARIAQASLQDVEDAIAAADRARVPWQKMLANEREALLHKAAEIIASQANEIRDLIIEETGSVFMKAPWEVSYAVECLRVAAACVRQPHGDTFPASAAGQIGMTIRQTSRRHRRHRTVQFALLVVHQESCIRPGRRQHLHSEALGPRAVERA